MAYLGFDESMQNRSIDECPIPGQSNAKLCYQSSSTMFKKLGAAYLLATHKAFGSQSTQSLAVRLCHVPAGFLKQLAARALIRHQIHMPVESILLDIRPPTRREYPKS